MIGRTTQAKMASVHKATTLVLMFCLLALGRAEYLKYKDPKQPVAVRIKDLLGRMTLAEKIGQMTQIERENATADALAKYFIGASDYTNTEAEGDRQTCGEYAVLYAFDTAVRVSQVAC